MKQEILRLTGKNGGVLPSGSAKQIAEMSVYDKEFHITERADAYTYIPLQEQQMFKLCATFQTNTMEEQFATERWLILQF